MWLRPEQLLLSLAMRTYAVFTTLHRAFLVARRKQSRFTHHDMVAVSGQLAARDTSECGFAERVLSPTLVQEPLGHS